MRGLNKNNKILNEHDKINEKAEEVIDEDENKEQVINV